MSAKWQQRKFYPKNPSKYRGDPTQIFMRSSWETRFSIWADSNPAIIEWSSETVVIPYLSPVDNRWHRYFVDFWIKVKDRDGKLTTYLVEIKPHKQSVPPEVKKGKHTKTLMMESATFLVNQAKWQYAKQYAAQRGWQFIVITENELGLAK